MSYAVPTTHQQTRGNSEILTNSLTLQATQLFKMLLKYRPYSKVERQQRLLEEAKTRAAGQEPKIVNKNEFACVTGFNAVTSAIEKKTAKLVIIADDVNPIELVAWMPTLCKKMEIPYVIVKGKNRLGTLIHQKRAACIAVKNFRKEDANTFKQFISAVAHKG